jgi:hypothetical protein
MAILKILRNGRPGKMLTAIMRSLRIGAAVTN